jgi:hypothetical protein
LENLIHLCRHHHRLVHEGGYAVERRRGGRVIFRRPGGRRIPDAPELLAGDPSRLIERTRRWAPDIDHESCVPQSGGDRLDYGIAVEGLLERDPPLSESVA